LTEFDTPNYRAALWDYHQARRRAALQEIMGWLTGKSVELLPYADVSKQLRARGIAAQERRDIPLASIVGSVGRAADFTRTFLPRHGTNGQRWARIKAQATGLEGFPPIDVYQIGDAYFVLDGNHRVSVARELGATHIEAFVTEVQTLVPFSPGEGWDDLLAKAEYADFLERTGIAGILPGIDLSMTLPGRYTAVEEHIGVHRYFMGIDFQRDIPYAEAVVHWHESVYQPVIQIIRRRELTADFPGRTETDLYVWLLEHRTAIAQELGWPVETSAAAADLAEKFSRTPRRTVLRLSERLKTLVPANLQPPAAPGQWRSEADPASADSLFQIILVPLTGEEDTWRAVDQAVVLAQQEKSQIFGLVFAAKGQDPAAEAAVARAGFLPRLEAASIAGDLIEMDGDLATALPGRARWADLVVIALPERRAQGEQPALPAAARAVIHRSSRPVLLVPRTPTALRRPLLAYDGSAKADEALYVAAHLTAKHGLELAVVRAAAVKQDGQPMERARAYLDGQGIAADYIEEPGPPSDVILGQVQRLNRDFVLIGDQSASPLISGLFGSVADELPWKLPAPVLICR